MDTNIKNKRDFKKNKNIDETKKYFLSKNNNIFKFKICKSLYQLSIKHKEYELLLNHLDLQILTKSKINSIDEAFIYISSLFEENKVQIRKIKKKKYIVLILEKIYVYNKEEKIEFILNYKGNNKVKIDSNLNQEKKSGENIITNYQNQNKNLENENNIVETYKKINDSYAYDNLDNTFIIFKSINNKLYLIYATKTKSIITFDMIGKQKLNEIKNAHNNFITNFRHYLDEINNRDLIISISCNDNNLKVWDFKNLDCILNIENINNTGALDSACIFYYNKQNYIITSNDTENDMSEDKDLDLEPESIKIFDFDGNKNKELNDSNYRTFFVDTYYDKIKNKTYILTGNEGFVQSYDYEEDKIYYRYSEYLNNSNESVCGHCSIIINSDKGMTRLLETSWDRNIRIWNFHQGQLITKINIGCLQGITLSNNNKYLCVGCDNCIKIINLKNGKTVKSLKVHEKDDDDKEILTIKTVFHPQYGEMLLSQSSGENEIKFMLIDNIINL